MHKFFVLCFAFFFLAGCDNTGSGPSSSQGPIMPLAVGNTWIYRVSFLNNDGSTNSSYYDTVRITSAIVYNGDSVFLFTKGSPGKLDGQGYWISNGGPNFKLIAKYPIKTGEVIRHDTLRKAQIQPDTSMDSVLYSTFYCKEFPSLITVPAGTYSAVKYQIDTKAKYSGLEFKDIYYYAPGVGNIYWISYHWEIGVGLVPSYKRELISVDLK